MQIDSFHLKYPVTFKIKFSINNMLSDYFYQLLFPVTRIQYICGD